MNKVRCKCGVCDGRESTPVRKFVTKIEKGKVSSSPIIGYLSYKSYSLQAWKIIEV